MSEESKSPTLEAMLVEYQKLLDARNLLDSVYSEIGGYGGMLSKELLMRLNNFYKFDDSE